MSKCIVIGGGFAGLSAAVHLSSKNIPTHLIEASPKLGGRAYSFFYPDQNEVIDNGQHIMMGCYKYTLELLRIIGSSGKVKFQDNLNVNFVGRGGKLFQLKAPSIPYPFNLLLALLNYKAIPFHDRAGVIKLIAKLFFSNPSKLSSLTVDEWLLEEGQSGVVIKSLWEILSIGTLNTTGGRASAETFAHVLKQIFLKGNKSSTIVLPALPLSQMYCEDSHRYITENNGTVSKSEKVVQLITRDDRVVKVVTNKNAFTNFDYVISAIPYHALQKVIAPSSFNLQLEKIEYSPILNLHVWLKNNPFTEKFYGLIDSRVHWVFNHNKYISLVTSSANDLINMDNDEIMKIIYAELSSYFPGFKKDLVVDYEIIKEKRATFIPDIATEQNREKIISPFENLFLAGDWTNTGLPSTIESAVKSGYLTASMIARHQIL